MPSCGRRWSRCCRPRPTPGFSTPAASRHLPTQPSRHRADPELLDRLQRALGSAYRVERELGGGGMARIFVATDTTLGRRVVLKVLAPELAAGLDAERFHREVRLAASLQHPHVVPLHAAGQADGLLYYTMPFVDGRVAAPAAGPGGAAPGGGGRAAAAGGRRRPRLRPPPRHHPPRLEAGQHPAGGGPRPGGRLRDRQGAGGGHHGHDARVDPERPRSPRPGWCWGPRPTWRRSRR